MSLCEIFLKLNISFSGKKIDDKSLRDYYLKIVEECHELNISGLVYVLDKDPLLTSLKFFHLLDIGSVPCLLPSYTTSYQCERIRSSQPGHLWREDKIERVQDAQVDQDEPCYAVMTSGSTGFPKLCFLAVKNGFVNAKEHCASMGITQDHLIIQSLPIYHSFGIVCYLFTLLDSKCAIDFNPSFLGMKSLNKRILHKAIIYLSPTQTRFILKEKLSFPLGIDTVSVGGGFIYYEELLNLQSKMIGRDIYVTYGLTEVGPRVTTTKFSENWYNGFLGKAFPSIKCAILDKNKEVQAKGEGRLLIKSPCLKLNTIDGDFIKEYFITEDQVSILEDGSLVLKGRLDDMINVGGINVYPQDIEAALMNMVGVKNVICLKKDSKSYGEVPQVILECSETRESVVKFLKEKLNVNQMPKEIHFIDKFPMIGLGKIDRKKIKDWLYEKK